MGLQTWTCLHLDCPPIAHSTSAGGQILMHKQQMPFSKTGQPGSAMPILHGTWWDGFLLSSTIPTGSSGVNSPSLEDTTLVPNSSEYADRPPLVNHTESEEANQQRPFATSPSVSRMAHLRDKF